MYTKTFPDSVIQAIHSRITNLPIQTTNSVGYLINYMEEKPSNFINSIFILLGNPKWIEDAVLKVYFALYDHVNLSY